MNGDPGGVQPVQEGLDGGEDMGGDLIFGDIQPFLHPQSCQSHVINSASP